MSDLNEPARQEMPTTTTGEDAGGGAIAPEILAKWRKVAEAALKDGYSWEACLCDDGVWMVYAPGDTICLGDPNHSDPSDDEPKFKFIVASQPTNFLALLDRIAALEARCKAAEEERDGLRVADEKRVAAARRLYQDELGEIGFVGLRDYAAVRARADTLAAENETLRRALIRNIAGRYPTISAALAAVEEAERAEHDNV